MKFVELFVEALFWVAIFLSPTLAFGVIALVVYAKTRDVFPYPAVVLIIGMICGALCAEWVKKKYGCSNFLSRLYGSGEVKEKSTNNE